MNLIFTTEEMIKALESIGYIIKLEVEEDEECYPGGLVIPRKSEVYNVYKNGDLMVNWGKYRHSRVEYVFREELAKKLLGLFSSSPGIRERESIITLFK